jgi:hypothetical protein
VRGIFGLVTLTSGLCHSAPAAALEPWEIPTRPVAPDAPASVAETVEAGVAVSLIFTAFGLGLGAAAASKDAESERKRAEPCRTCPGGFNDMQKDVEALGNAALFSFFAAGLLGASTAIFAITADDDEDGDKKKGPSAALRVQGSMLGVEITF